MAKVPLTSSQLLIWTGQKLYPDDPLYNMVLVFTLHQPIDEARFSNAFDRLIERHDGLRIVIEEEAGQPFQRIRNRDNPSVHFLDVSSEVDPAQYARKWVEHRARQPFDLSRNLVDAALIRLGPSHFQWFLNQHHLCTDGWTASLMLKSLSELYTQTESDPAPSWLDAVTFEQKHIHNASFNRIKSYWATKLEDAPLLQICMEFQQRHDPLHQIDYRTH